MLNTQPSIILLGYFFKNHNLCAFLLHAICRIICFSWFQSRSQRRANSSYLPISQEVHTSSKGKCFETMCGCIQWQKVSWFLCSLAINRIAPNKCSRTSEQGCKGCGFRTMPLCHLFNITQHMTSCPLIEWPQTAMHCDKPLVIMYMSRWKEPSAPHNPKCIWVNWKKHMDLVKKVI